MIPLEIPLIHHDVRSLFEVREELVFGLSGLRHALLATQPLGPTRQLVNATDSML